MEEPRMTEARIAQDEAIRRARSKARRQRLEHQEVRQDQVQAYRCMVANFNAATDSEMEMALFAR